MSTKTIDALRADLEASIDGANRLAALLALGFALVPQDPSEALVIGNKALALAETLNHKTDIAESLRLMGAANIRLGYYSRALHQLEAARAGFEALQDRFSVARTLNLIGNTYYFMSDLSKASECDQEALSIFEEIGDRPNAMRVLHNMAAASNDIGEYDRAIEQLQVVRAYYEEIGDAEGVAGAVGNLGRSYMHRGDFTRAMEAHQEACELFERLGQTWSVAQGMAKLGNILQAIGDYPTALDRYQTALSMSEQLGDRAGVAMTSANIANLYHRLGDHKRALEWCESASALLEDIGDREGVARCQGVIGNIYNDLGDYSRASDRHRAALAIADQLDNPTLLPSLWRNLGFACIATGDFNEALSHMQSALEKEVELGNSVGVMLTVECLGTLYDMPAFHDFDPARAAVLFGRGLELAVGAGRKPDQARMHQGLAQANAHLERWEIAHQHATQHYTLNEEIRSNEAHKAVHNFEHRRQIAEMDRQRELDRAEARAAELRAQLLESQLKRKQQEIASTAMHLAKQTEMLGRFRNDLRAIIREAPDAVSIVKRFNAKLSELPCEAIDWTKFEAEFQQTYPEFQSKLVERWPNLSKTEVRICTLLRLRLTSLDIAQLICLSERSVEWHRMNIRKKLGVQRGQDVHEVLSAI